jgi:hypothetical protein
MRRNSTLVLALSAVLALGVAGAASAMKLSRTTVQAGNLRLTFGGGIHQGTLPKHRFAPFTHTIFGKIKTTDGTHPSALREVVIDVDKDVKINTKGYPVCKAAQLEARDTKSAMRVCGKTIIGKGRGTAEVDFPEQAPLEVSSPLLIFNGGGNGRRTKLLAHIFLTVPVPAAIVTTVAVQKRGTGVHAVAKIPVIAGGSGSALDFRFTLGKTYRHKRRKVGYLEARCPDGVFRVRSNRTLFKNEAGTPGVAARTVLKGGLSVPCKGRG